MNGTLTHTQFPRRSLRAIARWADHQVLEMVLRGGTVELAVALQSIQKELPEVSSFDVAESVSRLHRRGLIRIAERLVELHGEMIRTAILTLP